MDMLSGGNFADGSWLPFSRKVYGFCRCGRGIESFGISGFPVLSGNCRRYCVQLFHPSATGNHTSAYARANRHISWH